MKYITVPQLAEMLGLSRTTVYRKVKSGKIPAQKIGHAYIISDKTISQILSKEPSKQDKKQISKAVQKVVKEYGETLKLLGNE